MNYLQCCGAGGVIHAPDCTSLAQQTNTTLDRCELTSYADLADIVENLSFLVREKRRERRVSARTAALEAGLSSSTLTRLDQGHTVSAEGLVALLRWMEAR